MFDPTAKNYAQVPYIPWKGKTFVQVTSSIQKNSPSHEIMKGKLLFMAPPLKIYRREIATAKVTNCNQRISASIDEFNSPGGYLVNPISSTPNSIGIINTLDINYENNSSEHPKTCSALTTNGVCLDPGTNARNRVRSAGMIKKNYNPTNPTKLYCTTSQQYLATRGMTFQQNQFNYNSISSKSTCETASQTNKSLIDNPISASIGGNSGSGVSGSARTAQLKYDTITNNGGIFSKAYGNAVGNAMAYGVSSDTYTIKDNIGYPNTCTPVFSKYEDGFRKCSSSALNHDIVPGPIHT